MEEKRKHHDEEVMEVALYAGHILLQNGAEIFRVEETMKRICRHYHVYSSNEFILSNGIFVTSGSPNENLFAKVEHIPVSSIRLDKVAAVNQLSRVIETGIYSPSQAMEALHIIDEMPPKKMSYQILASGVGSAAFCYLFGGDLFDAFSAFLTGLVLYIFLLKVGVPHMSKIVYNILGGVLLTMLCMLFKKLGLGHRMNFMIIGSIMPLIPGVAFTNGIRDIADGDYIAGFVRLLDAILTFFCIAMGVGLSIAFLNQMMGGAVL